VQHEDPRRQPGASLVGARGEVTRHVDSGAPCRSRSRAAPLPCATLTPAAVWPTMSSTPAPFHATLLAVWPTQTRCASFMASPLATTTVVMKRTTAHSCCWTFIAADGRTSTQTTAVWRAEAVPADTGTHTSLSPLCADQPATALSSLVGEFSFAIIDTSITRSLLIARSSSAAPALWWGTAAGGTLLISLSAHALTGLCERPAGAGVLPFPGGSYFTASDAGSVGPDILPSANGQLVAFRRPILHRGIHTVHAVNSSGALCGLGYYTQSGTMLSAMAM